MQNSYTKEDQFSWWLAPLWFHKGRGFEPLPSKIKNYFNFYPGPPASPPTGPSARPAKPAKPAQLEGPRALDISRARPGPLETLILTSRIWSGNEIFMATDDKLF